MNHALPSSGGLIYDRLGGLCGTDYMICDAENYNDPHTFESIQSVGCNLEQDSR